MNFERVAWLVTIAAGLLGAVLFQLSHFSGYALLSALLAVAASVNLLPAPSDDD